MKTTQDLFDFVMERMQKEASLEQIEANSNGDMRLYHTGQVYAYKQVAELLVNRFKCKATFIESDIAPADS
jgi:hypothetical protein